MKKILCGIISIMLVLPSFVGCIEMDKIQASTTTTMQNTTQPKIELYVAFQKGEFVEDLTLDDLDLVNAESFKDYRSNISQYSQDIYYNSMDELSQLTYRILEYAFDNCYTNIIFDERLTNLYYLPKVLNGFARDSALIEQNVLYFTDSDAKYTGEGMNRNNYIQVHIGSFSEEKYSKKMLALEKANSIVSNMPSGLTDLEKAKYFYNYLGKNVTYEKYGDEKEANYLYDALCQGKTHCDGFANAYSLLCNMAGVQCFEKITEGYFEIGHTWNTVCIDGDWYNVDVTGANYVVKNNCPVWITFGFCNDFQESTGSFSGMPKCPDNLYEIDCYFESSDVENINESIEKAFKKSAHDYIVICVEGEIDEDNDPIVSALYYLYERDYDVEHVYYYKLGGTDEYVRNLYVIY